MRYFQPAVGLQYYNNAFLKKKLERKISIIYDIYFEWFRIKLSCHTLDICSQGGQ